MTAISTCIACIVTPLISFIQEKLACEGPPCIDTHISYIYIYINHHYNIVLEPAKHLPSSKNPAFVLISIGLFFMFSIYRMSTAHAGWASARIHLNTFASPAKNSR